jgi:HAE1 family hydrophobic/amphiphilic exporter-1
MLASTCIAVLFIPSFYVLLQRLSEWHAAKKTLRKTLPDA